MNGRRPFKGGSLALSRERGCDHRSGYGGGEGISYGRRLWRNEGGFSGEDLKSAGSGVTGAHLVLMAIAGQ